MHPISPKSVKLPAMNLQLKTVLIFAATFLVACGGNETENATEDAARYSFLRVDNETCVVDANTGLTWAAKTDAAGLHHFANTYSWYDPNEAVGELDYRGTEAAGACESSACDTFHYVEAVNEAGLCGYNDWRMPARDELLSISLTGRAVRAPSVDTDFFPMTQVGEYWSGNDYSFQWNAAWAWNFQFGHDRVDWKREPKYVRLVRGDGANLPEVKE